MKTAAPGSSTRDSTCLVSGWPDTAIEIASSALWSRDGKCSMTFSSRKSQWWNLGAGQNQQLHRCLPAAVHEDVRPSVAMSPTVHACKVQVRLAPASHPNRRCALSSAVNTCSGGVKGCNA